MCQLAGVALEEAKAMLQQAGLHLPLLAKPLVAGTDASHGLAVVQSQLALQTLLDGTSSFTIQPPVVLQQYHDHHGCLFKVGYWCYCSLLVAKAGFVTVGSKPGTHMRASEVLRQ